MKILLIENDDFVKNGVKLALYRNNDLLCFLVNDELYFANTNEIEYNNKKYAPKEQIELIQLKLLMALLKIA